MRLPVVFFFLAFFPSKPRKITLLSNPPTPVTSVKYHSYTFQTKQFVFNLPVVVTTEVVTAVIVVAGAAAAVTVVAGAKPNLGGAVVVVMVSPEESTG